MKRITPKEIISGIIMYFLKILIKKDLGKYLNALPIKSSKTAVIKMIPETAAKES